jgi:hypothetical protein
MTQPTTTEPTVGAHVVITAGPTYEMTWDDSGDDVIGIEGTVVAIDPDWPLPYEVLSVTGETLQALTVRVMDDAYRAEQAAKAEYDRRYNLRRLELLDDALATLREDESVPEEVRERLWQLNADVCQQTWKEVRPTA